MSKRTKKIKQVGGRDDMVLIEGYYVPKEIASAYVRLKDYCVSELQEVLSPFCHNIGVVLEDGVSILCAVDNATNQSYRFELSPMKISQIEKAIGTKKLEDYIKEQKHG